MAVVNVPDVPGVPSLNFAPGAEEGIELLDSDGILALPNGSSQWGIFLNGAQVVQADSVVDFTLKKEWALSDAPQERGAFETYDKVQIPYDVRIRFSAGGSLADRAALLSSVEAIAGDLNLYDVVTPENVYTSCNVTHFDYKRSANSGAGLIVIDVWLFQVRVVGGAGMDSTQAASGADAVNGGTVQATDPQAGPYGDLSGTQQQFNPAAGAATGQAPAANGASPYGDLSGVPFNTPQPGVQFRR